MQTLIAILGGLVLGLLGTYLLLVLVKRFDINRDKDRARRMLSEGRIADSAEFRRITRSLAGLRSDREARELLTRLEQLRHSEEEPAPADCGAIVSARDSGTGALPTMPAASLGCPYCGVQLRSAPKRKRKCPSCGQYIFVRTRSSDNQRLLLTEEQAKRFDVERGELRYLNRWLGVLEDYGVTKTDFEIRKQERSEYLGVRASDSGTIWEIFNRLATNMTTASARDGQDGLDALYYSMALFLNEEGRDSFGMRQQSAKAALEGYRRSGIMKVKISANDDSCTACSLLNGKVFTIAEALRTMPIPCKECAGRPHRKDTAFCRCTYSPADD
ncbi:MAG: hypothetical protein QUS33_05315 [Dehalococcoidia bacterium]|nr:hypothetical protein [Dehalococcoidia bacterium]